MSWSDRSGDPLPDGHPEHALQVQEHPIPQHIRGWMYRVGVGLVPLLVFYGLVAESAAALWIGFLGAILSTADHAIAAAHTSTRRPAAGP